MRRYLHFAAVLVFATIAFFLIRLIPARADNGQAVEPPPVNVTVEVITPLAEVPDAFTLPAVVEANRVVRVAAEVAGRVEKVHFAEGSACKAGDPLISLNTELLQADHDRAAAQARYDEQEFRRMSSLAEGGAATVKHRDEAEYRMAVSGAEVAAARARLERAEIAAPISGVLNDLLVEKGEYVQAGTPVVEIVDIDTVKVVVQVPERDIHFFKTGDRAEVTSDATNPSESVSGSITYISALSSEDTRATRVEVTLDNRRHLLRSGEIVRIRLTRRMLKDVVMVPLRAIIPLENGKEAYVVQGDTAEARQITLGILSGDRVQVVEGLRAGDRLIVAGHRFVGPGQKVAVIEDK